MRLALSLIALAGCAGPDPNVNVVHVERWADFDGEWQYHTEVASAEPPSIAPVGATSTTARIWWADGGDWLFVIGADVRAMFRIDSRLEVDDLGRLVLEPPARRERNAFRADWSAEVVGAEAVAWTGERVEPGYDWNLQDAPLRRARGEDGALEALSIRTLYVTETGGLIELWHHFVRTD